MIELYNYIYRRTNKYNYYVDNHILYCICMVYIYIGHEEFFAGSTLIESVGAIP